MAASWIRATITWRAFGNVAKVVCIVAAAAIDPSGGAINAIATAIAAVVKAVSPRQESGTQNGEADIAPAAGHYGVVEDRMDLTFRAADGSVQVYEIPGPKDTCFIAGTDNVDPTDAAVAAIVAFIGSNAVTEFGEALTFVKGIRARKKQMKH